MTTVFILYTGQDVLVCLFVIGFHDLYQASVVSLSSTIFNNNTHRTSMEWAILPYDNKSDAFSALGDSGSIIADGHGRIGGLLTGGTGKSLSLDITYATPFFWLFPRIKKNGFSKAHLFPAMD